MTLSPQRMAIKAWLLQQLGQPYRWAGKGINGEPGFDCSGLVTAALVEIGGYPKECPRCSTDMRQFHGAARLWMELMPVGQPKELDLIFYGRATRPTHVVFYWGDGRVLGSNGGDPTTTTVEKARAIDAKVCFRPSIDYRTDRLGARALPIP